ncbi:MAG TPA: hypothetical protein VE862_09615 [Candidatus Acidoferrum sp.]|nr:hypothetical protein [Candidatus Acidoferrum sp.]
MNSLSQLAESEEQLVIINVGTKLPTTLALMSALRYAPMPILILDYPLRDRSYEYFSTLMKRYEFDLMSCPRIPLRNTVHHGETLDWLFDRVPSKKVVLMDSDLELLSPEIVSFMLHSIDGTSVFGSGWRNTMGRCPGWLPGQEEGLYVERFSAPFVMLKTSLVREAIRAGCSFRQRVLVNEFGPSQFVSRTILYLKHLEILRNPRIWEPLHVFRRTYFGQKPSWINFDTGAEIYHYLKYQRKYRFRAYPREAIDRCVNHYYGITRHLLEPLHLHGGTPLSKVEGCIRGRLKQAYQFDYP